MPNPVRGCLEILEDMVQILLLLGVLFKHDFEVEDLILGASLGSEPSLFFQQYSLRLGDLAY